MSEIYKKKSIVDVYETKILHNLRILNVITLTGGKGHYTSQLQRSSKQECINLLVIAERCARSSTSIATWTRPPSKCDMQGGTGASYSLDQKSWVIES